MKHRSMPVLMSWLPLLAVACGPVLAESGETSSVKKAVAEVILREDFDGPLDERLNMPEGVQRVQSGERGGVLKVHQPEPGNKQLWAEIYVPVESGHWYRAEIDVRTEGVSGKRGAVLLGQLADHDKGYISGGSFYDGVKGTRGWRNHPVTPIPPAFRIPDEVGHIHLLIGIEGRGTAWFDNLVVERLDELPSADLLEPENGATVHTMRPVMRFRSYLGQRAPDYRVEWSRSAEFPEDRTHRRKLADTQRTRPIEPLEPGRWHWRVWDELNDVVSETGTFTVADDAAPGPLVVAPRWQWSDTAQPKLDVFVGPAALNPVVQATIGGVRAEVIARDGGLLTIQPIEPLDLGVHTVKVRATAGEQRADLTLPFSNQQPGRRIALDEQGRLLVEGEPTFIVGAYRDPSDTLTDFSGLNEAGFNMTHSYDFENPGRALSNRRAERYLRDAHEAGLMVFMGLYRPWVDKANHAKIAERVGRLMDEPALALWYLADEPEWGRDWPANLLHEVNRTVKRTDPFRPTALVNTHGWSSEHWGQAADIAWVDPYPIGRHPLDMVYDRVHNARQGHPPGEPVWAVLGAFEWGWKKRQEAGKPLDRPDAGESRCMTHLALAGGAQGIVWYWLSSYKDNPDLPTDAPVVWNGLVQVVGETRELEPWLLTVPDEADAFTPPAPLRGWSRSHDGRRVVAIANPSDEPVTFDPTADERARWFETGAVMHGSLERENGRWIIPARNAIVWRTNQP